MTEQEISDMVPQSAGAQLAGARAERHLSIADIASKLRITPRQIEALEADDYARLPGHTIARGFVRNYARLLQLDPEVVLAAFEKHSPKTEDARISVPDQNVQFSESNTGHRNRFVLWLTLGILLLTALGYYGLSRWEGTNAARIKPAKLAAAPPPVVEAPVAPPSAPVADPAPALPLPAAPPVADITPAAMAEHVVHLAFDGAARIEVLDQNGNIVLKKTMAAGAEQDITASPPLTFTIGNAAKVKMTYNGDAFDLRPHIQGSIARFKLER